MNNLNILIVEGNLREENDEFTNAGIPTHTESLKESLNYFVKDLNFEVVNPSSDVNINSKVADLIKISEKELLKERDIVKQYLP